ncbi:hypothetical protein BJY59DRAFT_706764 [Rhodotorula toruloides]
MEHCWFSSEQEPWRTKREGYRMHGPSPWLAPLLPSLISAATRHPLHTAALPCPETQKGALPLALYFFSLVSRLLVLQMLRTSSNLPGPTSVCGNSARTSGKKGLSNLGRLHRGSMRQLTIFSKTCCWRLVYEGTYLITTGCPSPATSSCRYPLLHRHSPLLLLPPPHRSPALRCLAWSMAGACQAGFL